MPKTLERLLQEYRTKLQDVSEEHIKKVILYGSYARGDFKTGSDIDIMILVDLDEKSLKSCEDKIYDLTYDFNSEHDTEIIPVVQNVNHFNYWKKAYMFYKNVEEEGVVL